MYLKEKTIKTLLIVLKRFNHTVNSTYDTIVVVAHQILIRCALVYLGVLKREDAKQIHIENCKPIVVEI